MLVKVKACGICGSDLHLYKYNMFNEILLRNSEKGGIPGHEFSGIVEKVGSQVKRFKEGDNVFAVSYGAMAEYVPVPVIPGFNVVKLPSNVIFDEAATIEPLANSLHALMKAKPSEGANIIIFGAGTIGLGIIQCIKALELNLGKIIVVDLSDYRLKMAKKIGANFIINAQGDELYEKVLEIVGPIPMLIASEMTFPKVDVIYDCVGYMKEFKGPAVIQQAFNLARPLSGKVVMHGIYEDLVPIDFLLMVGKQITVIGSYGYTPIEVKKSIGLLENKLIDRSQIITHKFSMVEANKAFETSCKTNESVKVLIKP
ncbi:MAG: zinc-binding dehydrogenase [Promethearchaeota archaeon]